MKFPKITKTLPLVLALAMTTSCAFAEDLVPGDGNTQNSINTLYQLTLDTFFDIDVKAPAAATVEVDEDYTTLNITNSMVGMFEVVSNTPTKQYFLYGQCDVDGADPQTALYGDVGALKLVFTNSEEGSKPDAAAVTHITGGGQDSIQSPNAIAFNLGEAYEHEETPTDGWVTNPTFDDVKVTYNVANGKHTSTYTVTGLAQDKSFSTMDTKGTYKATLIMTDTEL